MWSVGCIFGELVGQETTMPPETLKLEMIQRIVNRYKGHPAVLGLEPVNEPWQYTPIEELKKFYWEGYLIIKRANPYWKYIMHDCLCFDTDIWGKFSCRLVVASGGGVFAQERY
jgi:hypothetical protein